MIESMKEQLDEAWSIDPWIPISVDQVLLGGNTESTEWKGKGNREKIRKNSLKCSLLPKNILVLC